MLFFLPKFSVKKNLGGTAQNLNMSSDMKQHLSAFLANRGCGEKGRGGDRYPFQRVNP